MAILEPKPPDPSFEASSKCNPLSVFFISTPISLNRVHLALFGPCSCLRPIEISRFLSHHFEMVLCGLVRTCSRKSQPILVSLSKILLKCAPTVLVSTTVHEGRLKTLTSFVMRRKELFGVYDGAIAEIRFLSVLPDGVFSDVCKLEGAFRPPFLKPRFDLNSGLRFLSLNSFNPGDILKVLALIVNFVAFVLRLRVLF